MVQKNEECGKQWSGAWDHKKNHLCISFYHPPYYWINVSLSVIFQSIALFTCLLPTTHTIHGSSNEPPETRGEPVFHHLTFTTCKSLTMRMTTEAYCGL